MTHDQGSWAQARAQAEELLATIASAEATIIRTIERECDAMRSGCLLAAQALHTRLCDSVKYYLDSVRSARASLAALEQVLPGSNHHLELRREEFAAVLKVELAVLASEYAAAGIAQGPMSFTGESVLGSARTEPMSSVPQPVAPQAQDFASKIRNSMSARTARRRPGVRPSTARLA